MMDPSWRAVQSGASSGFDAEVLEAADCPSSCVLRWELFSCCAVVLLYTRRCVPCSNRDALTAHAMPFAGGRLPECTIHIVGSKEQVAATSLQARRSSAPTQMGAAAPSVARIDCVPGTETAQVTLTGGMGFADFADNFTGRCPVVLGSKVSTSSQLLSVVRHSTA